MERMKEFSEVQSQIDRISGEMTGSESSVDSALPEVNERDLTLKKLEELKSHLRELHNEKVLCFLLILFFPPYSPAYLPSIDSNAFIKTKCTYVNLTVSPHPKSEELLKNDPSVVGCDVNGFLRCSQ